MTNKRRLVSVLVGVLFLVSMLVTGGVLLFQNLANKSNATNNQSASATIGNLYNTDGTLNYDNVSNLLSALQYTSSITSTTLTAPNIARRVGLSGMDNETSFVFEMGYFVNSSGVMDTSKPLEWQATYLRNGYLTIWLNTPYTVSMFNASSSSVTNSPFAGYTTRPSTHGYLSNYSYSTLRDSTVNIYNLLSSELTNFDTIIATPSTAASAWQTTQSDVYTYSTSYYDHHNGLGGYSGNYTGWGSSTGSTWTSRMSDKFWIPSSYEIFNTSTSSSSNSTTNGLWGLSAADNGFRTTTLDGSSTSYCWLRSGSL